MKLKSTVLKGFLHRNIINIINKQKEKYENVKL